MEGWRETFPCTFFQSSVYSTSGESDERHKRNDRFKAAAKKYSSFETGGSKIRGENPVLNEWTRNHKETGSGCIHILCNIVKNKKREEGREKGRQMVGEKRGRTRQHTSSKRGKWAAEIEKWHQREADSKRETNIWAFETRLDYHKKYSGIEREKEMPFNLSFLLLCLLCCS